MELVVHAVIFLTILVLFATTGSVWARYRTHRQDLAGMVAGIALLAFYHGVGLIEGAAAAPLLSGPLLSLLHAAGAVVFAVGLARWIRRSVHLISHFESLATVDELTRVLNRRGFAEAVEDFLRPGRMARPFALFLVDLNGFKSVNDRFGHDRGDVLLRDVAQDLQALVGPEGVCGRLGGDEFTLAVPTDRLQSLDDFSSRVQETVRSHGARTSSELAASVGYAVYPMDGPTLPELLRVADLRMYRAKRAEASS